MIGSDRWKALGQMKLSSHAVKTDDSEYYNAAQQ